MRRADQFELPIEASAVQVAKPVETQHPAWPGVVADLRKIVRRLQGEKLQLQSQVSVVTEERNRALENLKLMRRELVRFMNLRVSEIGELLRRVSV